MADRTAGCNGYGFVGDVTPEMRSRLLDLIRKSKSNATIVEYVRRDFGIDWSVRTLKRRLRALNITRHVPVSQREIIDAVSSEMIGPGKNIGYRHIHQRLRMRHDLPVKRSDVYKAMQTVDATRMTNRRKWVCRRRDYVSVGSNWIWHLDGNDKLKPYGFAIHAATDGFSRKILWCHIDVTNKNPKYIAKYYLDFVHENQVVPAMTRSDKGTENGLLATCQMFLRRNCSDSLAGSNSHVYGSSMRNQRIEAYWHNQREHNCQYWEAEFEYVYMLLLRKELGEFVEEHNSHRIRKQHGKKTPQGIPEDLYNFPELKGFKEAGFLPKADDLVYLSEEQGLAQEVPNYLAPDFRRSADAFFDIEITTANARAAYTALVAHLKDMSSD